MKLFLLFTLMLSFLNITYAQSTGLPATWNQNTAYSGGDLVISNGNTYLAQQTVPSGTALTSTAYWLSLDSAVPTNTPGTAPTNTPDTTTAPSTTPTSDANETQNAKLVSVSVRGQIGAGDAKRIMGFILSDTGSVMMRGIGPTLAEYGLLSSSLLPDPKISLFKYNDATNINLGSTAVSSGDNDNYTTNSNLSAIETARNASVPVVSLNSVQAISLTSLTSGFYTSQVENSDGSGTGIGVAAVDLTDLTSSAAFTHLSSRGQVSTGEFMFGSFQITGTGTRKVFIRGRGPSLSIYGVPNVMADTKLQVYKYQNNPNDTVPASLIATNDDFGSDANSTAISSYSTSLYGWPVIDAKEAGLILTLDPGYYSAQLQSTSATNDGNGWIGIDDVTGK